MWTAGNLQMSSGGNIYPSQTKKKYEQAFLDGFSPNGWDLVWHVNDTVKALIAYISIGT